MKITKTYPVKGMHCASCASIIERTIIKTDGVDNISVNPGTESANISFDESRTSPEELNEKLKPLGYSFTLPSPTPNKEHTSHNMTAEEMGMSESEHREHLGLNQTKADKIKELADMRTKLISAIPIAIISIFMMGWDIFTQVGILKEMPDIWMNFFHYLFPVMATFILFTMGRPYLTGLYRFIRTGYANMDTLVGLGTLVAFLYSFTVTAFKGVLEPYLNVNATYFDVTIIVIIFIALGKYLETKSKLKTGDAIEKLLNLQAKTAIIIRDGKEIEVPVEQVVKGDIILIKPGTKIPVDGIIIDGLSFVDESMVTGEPVPSQKTIGDNVVSGTINTTGAFTFRATKVGEDTLLAHIIKMVGEAQSSKAPIQAMADKISAIFVPAVLVIAFITLGLWLALGSSSLGFSQALSFGLVSFVGVLVIACPCALGLATPTAIIVGVGKGAREGILIKDATTLEKLHKVDTIIVDKTGTITVGKPTLVDIKNNSNLSDKEFVSIIASLEKKSEHPIANAIVQYAKENNLEISEVSSFEGIQGKGLKGVINKVEYFLGNEQLVGDLNLMFDGSLLEKIYNAGKTPVILATRDSVLGFVMVSDKVKTESKQAVADLHKLGIKVIMVTGDDEKAAKHIASLVGVDEVVAHVLPADKLTKIKELQANGKVVAMAGDGVNDAPALAQADVGIAMGTGTDVAIESAGITLLGGDVSKIVKAIKLSNITMAGIKQNLFWAFIYNVIGIPLAAGLFFPFFGWLLSPIFAGFAMAMSSVSVVSNSLRIKSKKL